jgi:hypothetical protein
MKRTAVLIALLSFVLIGRPDASDCTGTSTGLIPLSDPAGAGLYRGGSIRPAAHERLGFAAADRIVPRDISGRPAADGRIGFVSIGFSNVSAESEALGVLLDRDPMRNDRLVFVNGAQGGQAAEAWSNEDCDCWRNVDARVAAAHLAPAQVQAAWVKLANREPARNRSLEHDASLLEARVVHALTILQRHFPFIRIVFLSSRIYAGYSVTNLSPEPWAWHEGFAMKRVIERQLTGDPALNANPAAGPVRVGWLTYSYLWADGIIPRQDGLSYQCQDFAVDGTHPSRAGALKVARALIEQWRNDPVVVSWLFP